MQFSLDMATGVPVYRQIMDQVMACIAAGTLQPGDQLPTVRQMAVDLAVNPNTVIRAYRELELRGVLDTHHGSGTYITQRKLKRNDAERQRQLSQLVRDFVARAGTAGFTLLELEEALGELRNDSQGKKKIKSEERI
jgi:GntR family transcriptional regulator